MPGYQGFPITIIKGANFYWPITFTQCKAPVNLTGYKAYMQVRRTIGSINPPILDASTENGLIVITPAIGLITINIPSDITGEIVAPNEGYYDVLLVSTTGFKIPLIYGATIMTDMVTRL